MYMYIADKKGEKFVGHCQSVMYEHEFLGGGHILGSSPRYEISNKTYNMDTGCPALRTGAVGWGSFMASQLCMYMCTCTCT